VRVSDTATDAVGAGSVVVGTAGHIDHGKTALLRALTGIDADRLPEERRRGMTIDVGYAHLALRGGGTLDFVDVPGHDRLVGNMLVGAGEIDAAMLVVAADDGPRAQTLEHLELLDALAITDAIAVVTKADLLEPDDPRRTDRPHEVGALLDRTRFAGAPVLLVSAETGEGLDALRAALGGLRERVMARRADAAGRADAVAPRLAIDRAFGIRGRGAVVTGTLRGGPVSLDDRLVVVPLGAEVRVRGVQVHGTDVPVASAGRVALNLAGVPLEALERGQMVAAPGAVETTDRLLVVLRRPAGLGPAVGRPAGGRAPAWPPVATDLRLHLGTDEVGATIARGARTLVSLPDDRVVALLRLPRRVAAAAGDPFVLRRPSPAATAAGGRVLDPRPPVGPSRRRATPERLAALADATARTAPDALLDLHGALPVARWRALGGHPSAPVAGSLVIVRDVLDDLAAAALMTVAAHHGSEPDSAGLPVARLRTALALEVRRRVAAAPPDASGAASGIIDGLVATGRLARDGYRVRDPSRAAGPSGGLRRAMDALEQALAVPAPPALGVAVGATRCPPEGVLALEAAGRIVRIGPDLAYAASTHRALAAEALAMARRAPLAPATFRDATGTSRKYVMALLEDFDARGILARTPDGHVPGPRAAAFEADDPDPVR
jgi:selenocysteine-specific elongation factor